MFRLCIRNLIFPVFALALFPTGLGATVKIPGYHFLDSFAGIGPNQSVIVATVLEAENRNAGKRPGREKPRLQVILSLESVYWGTPILDSPIFVANTFGPSGNGWNVSVVVSRQWVLPGDRVLLLLEYHKDYFVNGASTGASFAKIVRFIGAGALADTTSLLEQSGAHIDWEAVGGNGEGESLKSMLESVSVERASSGYTLGNILESLPQEETPE